MNAANLQRTVALVLVSSLCCLGLANFARGQTPAAPAPVVPAARAATVSANATTGVPNEFPALRVAVSSISESRDSQGRSVINLILSLTGEGLPSSVGVKHITVSKAVDNLGNVLGSAWAGPNPMNSRSPMTINPAGGRGGVGRLIGQASLVAPVRKAESLAYAEGTIELFLSSEPVAMTIRIPNVLKHPGRIEVPALAKEGFEFHFLPNQASYDNAMNQVPNFRAGAQPPAFPNGVSYFLSDPSDRLSYFELQEANGTVIPTNGSWWGHGGGNQTGTIRLRAPLPSDAQLVFFLTTPETFKTVPFRVEDIRLP